MEPISFMFICIVAAKTGMAVLSVVGVSSGISWMSKKTFAGGNNKKGGDDSESEYQSTKFHRGDL